MRAVCDSQTLLQLHVITPANRKQWETVSQDPRGILDEKTTVFSARHTWYDGYVRCGEQNVAMEGAAK